MTKEKDGGKKEDNGALFIPAGVLVGLGVGFITGNIPAYLFIGIGAGFLLFALSRMMGK